MKDSLAKDAADAIRRDPVLAAIEDRAMDMYLDFVETLPSRQDQAEAPGWHELTEGAKEDWREAARDL